MLLVRVLLEPDGGRDSVVLLPGRGRPRRKLRGHQLGGQRHWIHAGLLRQRLREVFDENYRSTRVLLSYIIAFFQVQVPAERGGRWRRHGVSRRRSGLLLSLDEGRSAQHQGAQISNQTKY